MTKENENIDKIISEKIKRSLMRKTSDDFTDNLMKQINLSQQFAREDKKESKVLIYITSGISIFFLSFLALIGIFYFNSPESNQTKSASDYFSFLSSENILALYNKIGLSFSIEYLLILVMIIGVIVMSNFTDKLFLRKR